MTFCATSMTYKLSSATSATFWLIFPWVTGRQELERLVSALAEIRRRYQKDATGMLTQEYIEPEVVTQPAGSVLRAENQRAAGRKRRARVQRICNVLSAGYTYFGAGRAHYPAKFWNISAMPRKKAAA